MTVVRSVPVAATARLVGEHDTDLWRGVGAPSCSVGSRGIWTGGAQGQVQRARAAE